MIGVLTHHWAKEETINEAKSLLRRNGLAQSKAPGFKHRQTLYSISEPAKITTLVLWESISIYDDWRSSQERALVMAGSETLWSRSPESERFQVVC